MSKDEQISFSMNKVIFSLIAIFVYSATLFAQTMNSNASATTEKKVHPFIGVGFFPQPFYVRFSAGLEFGKTSDSRKIYSTIYAKAGNFGIENTFHSYYSEISFQLKQIIFNNESKLIVEMPIWLGNRNYIETFVEERHEEHNTSYFQIGSGLDIKFSISEKVNIISKIGVGYGPKYSFAGDFNFRDYQFEKFSALPLVDLGVRFKL